MAPVALGRRLIFPVLGAAWAYASIVFLFSEVIGGRGIGVVVWGLLLLGGLVALKVGLRWVGRRPTLSDDALTGIVVATGVSLFSLFVADTAYAVYDNARTPPDWDAAAEYQRLGDSHVWYGESYPRVFHPDERAFIRFKPNVRYEGSTYGEFYEPVMLNSAVLADSVLEFRKVDYTIDEFGHRDSTPPAESPVFALGDSYVFGHASADGDHWVDRLEALSGTAIYNLGIPATGPRLQLQVLTSLLEQGNVSAPGRVIWMLFEGNDLENTYGEIRPAFETPSRLRRLIGGTVLEFISIVPETIKRQSLITKFRGLSSQFPDLGLDPDRYISDGVPHFFPLFRSPTLGPRLFNPMDVYRATRPLSYVLEHPSLPALDDTFAEMKRLGEEHGFAVTVTVAPSAPRMHGAQFDGFPTLSDRPHFIEYVNELAERSGFEVFDLLGALQPTAQDQLLYFRDDHHWNAQGNAVVAEILVDALGMRPE